MASARNERPLYLVTGANAGIGYEIARGLANATDKPSVILACRDHSKGEAARAKISAETGNPNLDVLVVDLASRESVRRAAEEFSKIHARLDALVNNAGMSSPKRQESTDGIELTFATNVLGYFLLTNLLLDALGRSRGVQAAHLQSLDGLRAVQASESHVDVGLRAPARGDADHRERHESGSRGYSAAARPGAGNERALDREGRGNRGMARGQSRCCGSQQSAVVRSR